MGDTAGSSLYWILEGRKPVMVSDMAMWFAWMEKHDETRRVAMDSVSVPGHDSMFVSTTFFGLARCVGRGTFAPLLFESRVFGGPLDGEAWAYFTWEQAEAGHKMLTEKVRMAAEITALKLREKIKAMLRGEE